MSLTYTTATAGSFYGRFEIAADERDVAIGDEWHITTPQFENGNTASSFIISTSATTTRASDLVSIPTKNNLFKPPFSFLLEAHKNGRPHRTPRRAFGILPQPILGKQLLPLLTVAMANITCLYLTVRGLTSILPPPPSYRLNQSV